MKMVRYGDLRALLQRKQTVAELLQHACEQGGNVEGAAYWRGQAHAMREMLDARRFGELRVENVADPKAAQHAWMHATP